MKREDLLRKPDAVVLQPLENRLKASAMIRELEEEYSSHFDVSHYAEKRRKTVTSLPMKKKTWLLKLQLELDLQEH